MDTKLKLDTLGSLKILGTFHKVEKCLQNMVFQAGVPETLGSKLEYGTSSRVR